MISQKKEYLDKYLPRKNNNAQSKPLPQLKIIDPDMDFEKNSSQGEDEVPQLVNTQGLVLSDFQAKTLLKKGMLEADLIGSNQQRKPEEPLSKALKSTSGTWVSIKEETPQNKDIPTQILKEKTLVSSLRQENAQLNKETAKTSTKNQAKQHRIDDNDSDSDQSPIRKRHDSDSEHEGGMTVEQKEEKDQKSMKRTYAAALGMDEQAKDSDLSPERLEENDEEIEADRQRKLLKVAEQFKNAETVFRDEKGIKIDLSKKFEDKKAELLRKNQERILEWGGGLVQKQEKQEKKNEENKLKNEKFTNYEISKEREKELMGVDRFGDPMKLLMDKDKEKEKKTDNVYVGLKKKCKFRGIPNRFGIEPGHRWDGVDRSNGYERKYLGSINKRKLDKESKEMEHLKDM